MSEIKDALSALVIVSVNLAEQLPDLETRGFHVSRFEALMELTDQKELQPVFDAVVDSLYHLSEDLADAGLDGSNLILDLQLEISKDLKQFQIDNKVVSKVISRWADQIPIKMDGVFFVSPMCSSEGIC